MNAVAYWFMMPEVKIVSGYALMWNGYWCSHSWLVEAKGEGIDEGLVGGEDRGKREDVIIETCHQYSQDGRLHPGSFAAYYGIETSICRSQILH